MRAARRSHAGHSRRRAAIFSGLCGSRAAIQLARRGGELLGPSLPPFVDRVRATQIVATSLSRPIAAGRQRLLDAAGQTSADGVSLRS